MNTGTQSEPPENEFDGRLIVYLTNAFSGNELFTT